MKEPMASVVGAEGSANVRKVAQNTVGVTATTLLAGAVASAVEAVEMSTTRSR